MQDLNGVFPNVILSLAAICQVETDADAVITAAVRRQIRFTEKTVNSHF